LINKIIKKLLYGLLVLWGVITLVFVIFQLKPGNIADIKMGDRGDLETKAQIERELGLDLPFIQQYALYLNDLLPVSIHNPDFSESRIYLSEEDYNFLPMVKFSESRVLVLKKPFLRRSYQNGQSVSMIISNTFPNTAILAIVAIIFALTMGLILGTVAAIKKNSFFDKSSLYLAVIGMSGPSFFAAIIISWIGGFLWYQQTQLPILPMFVFLVVLIFNCIKTKRKNGIDLPNALMKALVSAICTWLFLFIINSIFSLGDSFFLNQYLNLPGTGLNQSGSLKEVDVFTGPYYEWKNLILPAITLGIRPLAVVVQLTRNSMLETMQQDYIRTARAKGLTTQQIVFRHTLRNAISPVITAVSGWFASMLAGAVFVEFVFGWQGLGLQIYEALINEDMPLVMGAVVFIASIFVLLNIVVDILYSLLDPRISQD